MLNLYTVLLSCFTNVSALLYYWATHRCIFLIISIQYLSYCVILLHICILLDNKGIPIENKVENEHSHCVKNPPIGHRTPIWTANHNVRNILSLCSFVLHNFEIGRQSRDCCTNPRSRVCARTISRLCKLRVCA